MKIKYIGLLFLSCLFACSGMNESIDPYLSQGEIIYIAKSDSAKLYAGKERFLVHFWNSDPRASEMRIYWPQKADSVCIPIPANHNITDSIVYMVGTTEKLKEGNYTLNFITYDVNGNKSIPEEYNINIYGNQFQSTLMSRFIKSAIYTESTNSLKITWGGLLSSKEQGVNIYYQNIENVDCVKYLKVEDLKVPTVISDININEEVKYETLYLPEPTAIDTFFTDKKVIDIQ